MFGLILIGGIALAAIIGTVHTVRVDGHRRVPTRPDVIQFEADCCGSA